MKTRRAQTSVSASPVLIGAVTVLIALIAVFIAYNANSGLPFVPTYDVKAQLPSGAKLVKGNEVRVGGFRVGVVEDVRPDVVVVEGERRSIAVAELKLDKTIEPLPEDSELRVRPRSALGLKYIELSPGTSRKSYARGDTIPLAQASEPLEYEDLFSTFDRETRPNIREATAGFGDAFAGRGSSLNRAIAALNPFFHSLTPVMESLSDPDTELDQFFLQMGLAADQVAPVARTQAAAVHRHGRHLRRHLERPRGAPADDREEPADDGRGDQLVPRPAPVPRGLHRPLGSAAPRGAGAAALAARDQPGAGGRHAGAAAHGGPEREARGRPGRGGGPVRQPEHAARPP